MKKLSIFILFLITLVIWISGLSCTRQHAKPVYTKNGKEYGTTKGAFFRHRWWNYYERGLSYMEGEFYKEAVSDLKKAIEQRDIDQRMARTYGMHFIDYFPHRELGIINYLMQNLEAAKAELKLSLSQKPSAKAYFYLDHVRKALIEHEAKIVGPPKLTLNFETEEIWTKQDPVDISGTAEDKHYIAGITINGSPLFFEGSQQRMTFEKKLTLSQGKQILQIEAKNLMGIAAKKKVIIHVDREGPVIILDDLAIENDPNGQWITITGSVYDEAGISELIINDEVVSIHKDLDVSFSYKMSLNTETINLLAHDKLGNHTSAQISLPSAVADRTPILLASAGTLPHGLFYARLFGPEDTRPPMIKLKGWTDKQSVFLEKIYLEGEVSDENKILKLTVNNIPILRRAGKIIIFSHFIELDKGENIITIEAQDEAGNSFIRKIAVKRHTPKALLLDERFSLTVFPFEQNGSILKAGLSFQGNLIDAVFNQNRFRMVERNLLDTILQEQKLSRTKLIDRDTALKLGKLVAAQSILTGSIIETRMGIEIVARIIDTETSQILATADVYNEGKNPETLQFLTEGMAVKFHRDFPLVDGMIVQRKGEFIFTDLGQDKIKLHRRLIIYREEQVKHPLTGKVLGADTIIIDRARITQVSPEMSKARILAGKDQQINSLDKVIAE